MQQSTLGLVGEGTFLLENLGGNWSRISVKVFGCISEEEQISLYFVPGTVPTKYFICDRLDTQWTSSWH